MGSARGQQKETGLFPSFRIKHENIVALEDIYESPNHLYRAVSFWLGSVIRSSYSNAVHRAAAATISWELVGNSDSQAPPGPTERDGAMQSGSQVICVPAEVEKHWSRARFLQLCVVHTVV